MTLLSKINYFIANLHIDENNFLLEQSKKKAIDNFNNIDAEIEEYARNTLGKYYDESASYDEDESQFREAKIDECVDLREALEETRRGLLLSTLSTFFHKFEKDFTKWAFQILNANTELSKELKFYEYKDKYYNLLNKSDFFNSSETAILQFLYSNHVEKYRLIVNVYKHGKGSSFESLSKSYPEYFKDGITSPENLIIEEIDIVNFVKSINDFWLQLPKEIDIKNLDKLIKAIKKLK